MILLLFLMIRHLTFCSTRVSNELGAGNPKAARVSVLLSLFQQSLRQFLSVQFCSALARFSDMFTAMNQKCYVTKMTPLLSLSVIMDTLYALFSGLFLLTRNKVVDYVTKMTHLLSLSVIMDSSYAVLSVCLFAFFPFFLSIRHFIY